MAPRTKKTTGKTKIENLTHKDKRVNIPTEELRDMVADEEKSPQTLLYPRDTSLDPQLVWKGKDEQDRAGLLVPVVPIYIQEKIQPLAIIEDLRRQQRKEAEAQQNLFSDFNGIDFEKQVDFYHHKQNWTNRMILGDSLLVMQSLSEKEAQKGEVQMIYIDPPYGIKFGSNWQTSTRKRDVKDGKRDEFTRQPEQVKAFRDTWEFGIHSYLAYLRDRLHISRELLTDTGSVFVQIGDENVHLVRSVLDEVFGSENYVALINYTKTSGQTAQHLAVTTDYVLWYGKSLRDLKYRPLYKTKSVGGLGSAMYQFLQLPDQTVRRLTRDEQEAKKELPAGSRAFRLGDATSQRQGRPSGPGSAMYFPVRVNGTDYFPSGSRGWSTTAEGMARLARAERLTPQGDRLSYRRYIDDFGAFDLDNNWGDTAGASDRIYVVQTNPLVIERCLLMTTDPGDLVLDPTCGSGTTAEVAEQWGRRWITSDTSRVALALARTRLMAAKFSYYLLSDSTEGIQKEAEITGQIPPKAETPKWDVRKGFVYRRQTHVKLSTIANNEEIDAIQKRWQPETETLRALIKKTFKRDWEEWEIPRPTELKATKEQKEILEKWWTLRLKRQNEIDDSIARSAKPEYFFDEPYPDNTRIRVAGPFTVESLSPHRVISADKERPASEIAGERDDLSGQYEPFILDNLRKAGVQNTFKNERLKFDRLDPSPGEYIQATGEYTDSTGKPRRVAVHIGPQYGTVGPDEVKEAAKEAVKGIGFDILVVCGFAFDPHVSEEAKRYGKLTVLPTRMNSDLLMGEDLLKKTGAGNLFTVFGEPDIDLDRTPEGKIVITLKGLDIYDPTTGEIRQSSPDEIACWFIDTSYNDESFFVRHAYFTGADEPYEKLKRALRAEIDESAWSALYSTKSRPFDPPKTGKIAVKVINHYGDEILKVFKTRS